MRLDDVVATDPNADDTHIISMVAGMNGKVKLSLKNCTDAAGIKEIVTSVVLSQALNYELPAERILSFTLKATAPTSLHASRTFKIPVRNVNEYLNDISLSNLNVNEHSASNTLVVGIFQPTALDAQNRHRYDKACFCPPSKGWWNENAQECQSYHYNATYALKYKNLSLIHISEPTRPY